MTDRFDLEQHIMKCWNITEEIDLLNKNVLEKNMSTDDISNFLLGLKTIYNAKFDDLFDNFSELVEKGSIK
jgi:hypothetical protein